MKITFDINVGIDVPNYKEAGKMLDKIVKNLEENIGTQGRYDIGSFQARHRPLFKEETSANLQAYAMREPEPDFG